MNRFVVLLDGDMTPTPRLERQVSGRRAIAADGGIRHAPPLGVVPETWLGDFDSAPERVPDGLSDVPRLAYPRDKDATDGEIAVEAALERGADELLLVGAFGGGRADHALLHGTMALGLARRGVDVVLSDGSQEGRPILPGNARFDFANGALFSLIGFSDLAGLSIRGVKWPLNDVDVPLGSSLTLSNEVTGGLEIDLAKGRALLVAQLTFQDG